jgi:hypothetical protein
VPRRKVGLVGSSRGIIDGKHAADREEVFRVDHDHLILRIDVSGCGNLFFYKASAYNTRNHSTR